VSSRVKNILLDKSGRFPELARVSESNAETGDISVKFLGCAPQLWSIAAAQYFLDHPNSPEVESAKDSRFYVTMPSMYDSYESADDATESKSSKKSTSDKKGASNKESEQKNQKKQKTESSKQKGAESHAPETRANNHADDAGMATLLNTFLGGL
jgi:thiol:disulfide interchange protein